MDDVTQCVCHKLTYLIQWLEGYNYYNVLCKWILALCSLFAALSLLSVDEGGLYLLAQQVPC